jgi:hypothetical protein
MTYFWNKLGLIYTPNSEDRSEKLMTHAANPLPVLIKDDIYRVFYSGRDCANRSSVGAVDIDIVERTIIHEHSQPIFEHGDSGSYYGNGVSIGNCYESDEGTYMLFMGWQNIPGQHWRGDIGRLLLNSDLSLHIDQGGPFIGSDSIDPISLSYPWVLRNQDGTYDMWYGSTESWDAGNGEMLHVIKFASSKNGHEWVKHGVVVPFAVGIAQAFSRPSVVRNVDNSYEMWFSYRNGLGDTYRIGHAVNQNGNGQDWIRTSDDISLSSEGWDSEMIEYPYVLDHKGKRYMLYNGNGYGASGIGLAVQEHT